VTIYHSDPWLDIHGGDCRDVLATLPAESVHCVVTSPPYWGLRSYGVGADNGELGCESTPEEYVANMVAVFREVRRVLRDDGTVWLNLGDSYSSSTKGDNRTDAQSKGSGTFHGGSGERWHTGTWKVDTGLKPKDLVGIPWRTAFALQADGWYLRSDIIWAKPNPMPESVTDRPTKAHEYLFLLTKRATYWYDADAVREAESGQQGGNVQRAGQKRGQGSEYGPSDRTTLKTPTGTRNRRSVWYDKGNEAMPHLPARPAAGPVLPSEGATLWSEPVQAVLGTPGDGGQDDTGGAGAQAPVGRALPIVGEGQGHEATARADGAAQGVHGTVPSVGGRQGGAAPGEQDGEGTGATGAVLRQPEGAGSAASQAPVRTRQGDRCACQAQASDDAGGPVGGDCCRMGDDPSAAERRVCLLPPTPSADDGAHPPAEPRRTAHAGECCGCVSELQQQQEGADAGGVGRHLTDLWQVATQPYPGAHFAVMPEALVEPCILAGCPDQTCSECGAPWERVVERKPVPRDLTAHRGTSRWAEGATVRNDTDLTRSGQEAARWKAENPDVTTGWKPICAHHDAPTVPGTALDPFGGSGTVARVANRLSRRAVLIDLNPDYLEQQLARNGDMPLGLVVA
jgi:DNA modification methylase